MGIGVYKVPDADVGGLEKKEMKMQTGRRRHCLLALLITVSQGSLRAQQESLRRSSGPALEPALVQAIRDYDQAQIKGDRAELERLVAADYLIVGSSGLGDKARLIESVAGEGIKTAPYAVVQPFTRNYGATVVTGGWVDLRGTDHGKPWEQKTRFADVWSRRNGRWWVVMTTLTPSDKP